MRLDKPNVDEHAWVIATEADLEGTAWGRRTGKVVAARIRGLAKATLATLQAGVAEGTLVVEVRASFALFSLCGSRLICLSPRSNSSLPRWATMPS